MRKRFRWIDIYSKGEMTYKLKVANGINLSHWWGRDIDAIIAAARSQGIRVERRKI